MAAKSPVSCLQVSCHREEVPKLQPPERRQSQIHRKAPAMSLPLWTPSRFPALWGNGHCKALPQMFSK